MNGGARFLRRRDPVAADQAEAGSMRKRIDALKKASEDARILAEWVGRDGGQILLQHLERQVDEYKEAVCWIEPSLRELGKAERSKELLRYLVQAEQRAAQAKAEAERLASLLEQHEKSGRVKPAPAE